MSGTALDDSDFALCDDIVSLDEYLLYIDETHGTSAADVWTNATPPTQSPNLKQREKNREAQARFRLKGKQKLERLQRQLTEVTQAIAALRAALSQHQVRKDQLMKRSAAACSALVQLRSRLVARRCDCAITGSPGGNLPSGDPRPCPAPYVSSSATQGWSTRHAGAISDIARSSAVTRRGRSITQSLTAPQSVVHPTGSYAHHARLTFEDLAEATGGLRFSDMLPDLSTHIQAAQMALAPRMRCRAGEVCWYLPSRYDAAPGLAISHSMQLGSSPCIISFVISWLLGLLEAGLLTCERDHLARLANARKEGRGRVPGLAPSSYPGTAVSHTPPNAPAPTAPPGARAGSPDDHDWLECRCGVNQSMSLCTAIPHALTALLEKFSRRLPARGIAVQCGRFQTFLANITAAPSALFPSDSRGAPPAAALQAPVPDEMRGMHAVVRCMSDATEVALSQCQLAATQQAGRECAPTEGTIPAAMAKNDRDLSGLGVSHCLSMQVVYAENKKQIRQMSVAVVAPLNVSFSEVEHVSVAMYTRLSFTEQEARAMRALWGRVRAHRTSTNEQYAALAASLTGIASAASGPVRFVQALAALCVPGGSSAADAAAALARGHAAGRMSRHGWARHALGASAVTTTAAGTAVEGLWGTLEDELAAHTVFAGLAHNPPCMSVDRAARFYSEQLALGAFVVDGLRMCQLAAQETRWDLLLDLDL